ETPWTSERAAEFDTQTLQTWFDARISDPLTMSMARLVVTALFTAEPSEISLLHALVYIKSAGSISALTQVKGGAQETRFVKGAQDLSEKLADSVGRQRILLNAPVRRIVQVGAQVVVESDAEVYTCA